jgi:hypothetical protein
MPGSPPRREPPACGRGGAGPPAQGGFAHPSMSPYTAPTRETTARTAIGVSTVPLNLPVVISAEVEMTPPTP